jgi:WD40 repeat protein
MSPRLPNGLLVGTLAACLWFPTEAPAQPAGVDAYGDPLPFGALARLGTQRFRHGSLISSLTFSPNGQALASLGADSHIRLWDFATGGQLWHLMTDGNTSYDFSPDGKHLAVAEGGWTLYLQEVGTDKVLRKFEEKFTPINDVRFSPDGQTLVTSSGQLGAGGAPRNPEVIQWSVTTGNVIRRFGVGQAAAKGKMLKSNLLFVWFAKRVADFFFDDLFTDEEEGEGYFQSAAFSPDGQAIAAVERHNGGRAVIRFWSTATGKELRHWGIADEVQALLFSPDGKTLATTGRFQPQIVLWDAATGKELRRLGVAQELLGGLAFSPDSKLLAAAFDHSPLVVWDVATGKEVKQLTAPGRLFAVAFSEDGKVLAAGGSGGVIHRWKTGTWAVLPPDSGHQAVIERVALLPGGQRTLSVAADGTLRTWDTATGREVSRLTF